MSSSIAVKNIKELEGEVLIETYTNHDKDSMLLVTKSGWTYELFHPVQCCEEVRIEDVCGDLADVSGSVLLTAEERTSGDSTDSPEQRWTFYELATIKGSVTIRWYGSSNGYYSVGVNIRKYKTRLGK